MDMGGRHVGERTKIWLGNVGTGVPPRTPSWWLRQSMVARRCTLRCTDMLVGSTQKQGSTGQVEEVDEDLIDEENHCQE